MKLCSVFSKLTSSLRNRFNQECVLSTTQRRALCPVVRTFSSVSCLRDFRFCWYPCLRVVTKASQPTYPASMQSVSVALPLLLGRAQTMRRSVASSSFTSCALAPLATRDSGMPRASTSRLRLRPFFPPIRGMGTHTRLRQGCLAHAPIDALPAPGDALHLIVFGQPCLPEAKKKSCLLPALKMSMHRTGTAELAR